MKKKKGNIFFDVVIGRHTGIYPASYKKDASTTIIIDEYEDFGEVQEWIVEFLPESAYYDRNVYNGNNEKIGQELAFDLDPENIICPIHGSLEDKMKRHQGLGFCQLELQIVKRQTMDLYEYLKRSFSSLKIVYSGRGFHIHVLDVDVYKMTFKERKKLAKRIKARGFPIDEWVTSGEMRLIRLPYSLNGLVSRVAIPLEVKELYAFNPVKDDRCKPEFIRI